jgi:hypothetical protein
MEFAWLAGATELPPMTGTVFACPHKTKKIKNAFKRSRYSTRGFVMPDEYIGFVSILLFSLFERLPAFSLFNVWEIDYLSGITVSADSSRRNEIDSRLKWLLSMRR